MPESTKDAFRTFVSRQSPRTSNTKSSYAKALDLLEPILNRKAPKKFRSAKIWQITDPQIIKQLYDYVIDQQRAADNGIFRGEKPEGYWRSRFMSAALGKYRDFLLQTQTQHVPSANLIGIDFVKVVEDMQMQCALVVSKGQSANVLAGCIARQFVLLSGLSGSGKTLLASFFSHFLSKENGMTALIPIGANWTSKDDLLGYPDALRPGKFVKRPALELLVRAYENWKLTGGKEGVRPFFLILDEMNLSHVERYFSDFLSAMESGGEIELHDLTNPDQAPDEGDNVWDGVPARIKIPGNLFVIGTVNVDETTYMFSPKVLDRANVIEFRADKKAITDFLGGKKDVDLESIAGKGAHFGEAFVHAANMDTVLEPPYSDWLKKELDLIFEFLSDHEGEFGFRTARAITRFVQFSVILQGNPDDATKQRELFIEAMDAQVMQKILPKMHGSKKKLGPVLRGLAELCTRGDAASIDGTGIDSIRNTAQNKPDEGSLLKKPLTELMKECRKKTLPKDVRYPVSLEKVVRMLRMLDRDGFASFAEA